MKKLTSFLILFTLIFSITATATYAETDLYADVGDVELEASAGLTPDSPLYFLDSLFETADDPESILDYNEEKIAEAEQMIKDGKPDAAKTALEKAEGYSKKLTKDVTPSMERRATESSKAVTDLLDGLDDDLEGEEWEDVKELATEQKQAQAGIAKAVQVAAQIKNLCTSLAELDFEMYADTCKTGDDSPGWQKDLDRELTAEQEVEAKNFHGVITSCFASEGKNCRCDEINSPDFAAKCTEAASLASDCDDGDESACTKLESFNMPRLPDHLQSVFDDVEGEFSEAKFKEHKPKECEGVEASECGKKMATKHAPPECQEAFATMLFESESDMWDFCAKLGENIQMNSEHPACAENGITDAEECKDFLWNVEYRDPVCQSHEIHDYYDCNKFLGKGGTTKVEDGAGGKGVDTRCTEIEDSTQRLQCYDNAANGIWQEIEENLPTNLPDICLRKHAYTQEACDETVAGWEMEQNVCDDCESKCPGASSTYCGDNGCECVYGDGSTESVSSGGEEYNECKDGCDDECPGASSTSGCENNGNICICHYDDPEPDSGSSGGGSGGSGGTDSGIEQGTDPEENLGVPEDNNAGGSDSGSSDPESSESSDDGSDDSSSDDSGDNTDSSSGGSGGGDEAITGEVTRNPFIDFN